VHAGVDLRVPARRLRYTEQRIDLRKDHRQCTAGAQGLEEHLRVRLGERALGLLPDALGNERARLAASDDATHEREGFVRHTEPESRKTCGEACHTQDPYRILDEGFRHVSQPARREIRLPAIRVDERAVLVLRHRVDGQIAAPQVLLERHGGGELRGETAVTRADLALLAGEGVLLMGYRVEEDRKLAADGLVTQPHQLLGCRAYHHPVALADRKTE